MRPKPRATALHKMTGPEIALAAVAGSVVFWAVVLYLLLV